MRRILGTAIVVVALLTASATASSASPPIHCGDTVSGSVALTHSLTCTGVALHLAGATDLDLGGFALRGPGSASGISALAFDEGVDPVTLSVRNGTVKAWGTLVTTDDRPDVTTTDVTLVDLGRFSDAEFLTATIVSSHYRDVGAIGEFSARVRVSDSVLQATWIQAGDSGNVVVEHSTIKDVPGRAIFASEGIVTVSDSLLANNGTAIYGSWTGVTVTGSVLRSNGTAVVSDHGGDTSGDYHDSFVDSTFVDNGTALQLGVNATVSGNDFRRNGHGVDSRTGDSFLPATITLDSNSLRHNGDAIYIDGPSILHGNLAIANTGIGIYTPGATDLGGNIASHNGVDPQCVGVLCTPH